MRPNGGKWWRRDYRFDQKRKTLSCGVYPDVGLAEARAARDVAKELLVAGTDPSEARRQTAPPSGSTVAELGRAWHKSRKSGWTKKYADTVIQDPAGGFDKLTVDRNVVPLGTSANIYVLKGAYATSASAKAAVGGACNFGFMGSGDPLGTDHVNEYISPLIDSSATGGGRWHGFPMHA